MKRLILVYNPRSSQQATIQAEVLDKVRDLSGWMVGKFAVVEKSLDENAAKLAKMINDGDLVISVGGDGTAAMAANGVILSGKEATFGVLGYGNFNDVARMLGMRREDGVAGQIQRFEAGQIRKIYPLDISVNGKHWRYAPCYMTMGLFAESTEVFDEPKVRAKLKTGKKKMLFSLWTLGKWYLKNRKKEFLPVDITLNGKKLDGRATDYMAINGPTVAKMMKGGEWYDKKVAFGSGIFGLGKLWKMVIFGLRSVRKGVPVVGTEGDEIVFAEPSSVEVHAEGEYHRLEGVSRVEVKKGVGVDVVFGM